MRSALVQTGGHLTAAVALALGGCALQRYDADIDELAARDAGSRDGVADSTKLVPPECAQVGAECGLVPNSLGGVLDCGDCALGECEGNHCHCTRKACGDLGSTCGLALDDGCGGVVSCYCFAASAICFQGECCTPKTCAQLGCGVHDDGCGGSIDCGSPLSCANDDAQCGSQSDRCGGTIDCPCRCSGIAGSKFLLCEEHPNRCIGVFLDHQGCVALCGRVGMQCTKCFGGEPDCQPESHNTHGCDDTSYESNWCECR